MTQPTEQFNPSDNIRKELDAKVESNRRELDTKIEQKVSNHVFYVAITILVAILGFLYNDINKINDKQSSINERIASIATQIKSIKSK